MNNQDVELRGSTWDHVRGFDPMQATARQFMREHPSVRITWERRTLQEFAEQSVLDLAEHYDLVVLDHPWIGAAVDRKCLLPLDEYLDAALLADQSSYTVGPSHSSYQRDGHQRGSQHTPQVKTCRAFLAHGIEIGDDMAEGAAVFFRIMIQHG